MACSGSCANITRRICAGAKWPFVGFVGCLALAQGASRRDARDARDVPRTRLRLRAIAPPPHKRRAGIACGHKRRATFDADAVDGTVASASASRISLGKRAADALAACV